MGMPDAPGASPLDHAWLGIAVLDSAVALGTLLSALRPCPQALLDRTRQAVRLVRRWLPARELIVVADSTYAALEWLDAVRQAVCVITCLRLDAALYGPAPPRQPKQNGRPRKKGTRLPTLEKILTSASTRWKMVTMAHWYGESARQVQITSSTAVWYHSGKPVVPVQWVLIRDPEGRFAPQALLATHQQLTPEQAIDSRTDPEVFHAALADGSNI
jgi:hypothetical protein